MKNVIVAILLVMVFVDCLSGATLRISPDNQHIAIDSAITVSLRVDGIQGLHAYSLKVSYDPSMLQCRQVKKSTIFSTGNSFFFSNIDSMNGLLSIDEALLGFQSVSDSGTLVRITFVARQEGRANLEFTLADFRDTANLNMAIAPTGAQYTIGSVTGVEETMNNSPSKFQFQNYPNPFNSSTTIRINIQGEQYSHLPLTIYSVEGKIIKTLDMNSESIGFVTGIWDGTDNNGIPVVSGIYFARFLTQSTIYFTKLILLK